VTCKGTGRLLGGGTCPICKGTRRVAASAGSALGSSGRDELNRAKARRARRAYVSGGDHATPKGKYSDDEIQVLGERGLALAKGDGSYHYPVADTADLINAMQR
jgi:hypothetical protein